ncbi:MAG: T9SS type A sorting domain-containing protein [Ignavibacteriota bacterium]
MHKFSISGLIMAVVIMLVAPASSQVLSGFTRWTQTGPSETVVDLTSVNSSDYLLTGGGLYRSSDDLAWKTLKKFLSTESYNSVIALPTGEILLFSYGYYNISFDSGATWKKVIQSGFSTRKCIADNIGYIYSGQNDPIQLSKDKGATWMESSKGTSGGFFDIRSFATDAAGNVVAGNQGITGGMVYRTADHGSNWNLIHAETLKDVYTLAINNGTIWISYADKLIYSDDNGLKWNSAAATPSPVTALLFTGENEGFAGLANGKILYTAERGNSWDDHMVGLHGKRITLIKATAAEKIVAGTDSGLFILTGSLGVENEQGALECEMTVNPNPTTSDVSLFVRGIGDQSPSIEVYDLLGHRMDIRIENENHELFRFSTTSLVPGPYTIVLKVRNQKLSRKLIVR